MSWTATIKPLENTPSNLTNGNFTIEVEYQSDDGREHGQSYQVSVNNFSDSNYLANLIQGELNNFEAYDNVVSSVNKIAAQPIAALDSSDVPMVVDETATPVDAEPVLQVDSPAQLS